MELEIARLKECQRILNGKIPKLEQDCELKDQNLKNVRASKDR